MSDEARRLHEKYMRQIDRMEGEPPGVMTKHYESGSIGEPASWVTSSEPVPGTKPVGGDGQIRTVHDAVTLLRLVLSLVMEAWRPPQATENDQVVRVVRVALEDTRKFQSPPF